MRTFAGTVENGTVRLPADAHLRDGTRVVVTVMPRARKHRTLAGYAPELEAEDARFVQACRGRPVRELRDGET
ncbi:MAG: hypothetical protein FJ291_04570 [Planctomycetes bacterium]|nr:hypothetical protein [Planctomycetota bacterium]